MVKVAKQQRDTHLSSGGHASSSLNRVESSGTTPVSLLKEPDDDETKKQLAKNREMLRKKNLQPTTGGREEGEKEKKTFASTTKKARYKMQESMPSRMPSITEEEKLKRKINELENKLKSDIGIMKTVEPSMAARQYVSGGVNPNLLRSPLQRPNYSQKLPGSTSMAAPQPASTSYDARQYISKGIVHSRLHPFVTGTNN